VSGRYRVVRQLGEGGMGQVYLAIHEAIEKQVALKVLRHEYSAKEEIITRFQQEAISASRIKHPNVLEVFDFGTLPNGCAFLAMEFLHGNDVADELVRVGYLDTPRAIRIMLQVCRALSAAHRAGVVHRDMKPDNIFLLQTADGEEIVKIVDFGIAQLRNPEEDAKSEAKPRRRLTRTGMIFGTPEYMAPEQAAGRKADSRVDVYACGIIMFEMLTGAVPFTGDSFMAVLAAHLNDPAPSMMEFRPDLTISEELHDVVRRMLEKKPENRYQSMGEVAKALVATPEGSHVQRDAPMSIVQAISSIPPPAPGHATASQFNPHAEKRETPSPGVTRAKTSHTLEAATTNGAAPKKGGMGIAIGAAAFLLVGGGAAAFFFVPELVADGNPVATETQQAVNAPTNVPVPPTADVFPTVAATAAPDPTVASVSTSVVAIADSPKVTVKVESTPSGAKVMKDGFQVCDATPCEIEVERGEAIELLAQLGNKKGTSKIEAQKDQAVQIVLRAPRPNPGGDRMCEVTGPGGLKIVRKCPN
jgi:eukaryotic-like serine/threonine-protein kinase